MRPSLIERLAVGRKRQSVLHQCGNRGRFLRDECRVEQPLRRIDSEIVGQVEDVRGDRHVERAGLNADVHVTVRGRVGAGGSRAEKHRGKGGKRHPLHQVTW